MASKPEDSDAAKANSKAQDQHVDDMSDVPDPDEDDLDDLDDMLDDFSAVKIDPKEPQVSDAGPGRPSTSAQAPDAKAEIGDGIPSEDDFAKQLQAGMAELMGEMESSPEMQAQFESIFKEFGVAAAAAGDDPPAGPGAAAAAAAATATTTTTAAEAPKDAKASSSTNTDASFKETIRRTMERMQASGEQATAAAQSEGSDDFMAELLKQMQAGDLEGGMEGGEEEFSKMLLGMMEQLTNKDILYEPMKELNDKFPEWLEKNKGKISEEDRQRYGLQQEYAKDIVARFEQSTYSDANAADREYIVDKMQKMQAAGSPPPDLVGDMPSAQDALGAPDAESCNPQ